MKSENMQRQMRKGVIEFCVLSILRKNEAYPSEIIEQMKEADFQLLEGTLYPLLTRLKNGDLINYRWEESPSGPPRKYFSITAEGESFYQQLLETWSELNLSVNKIIANSEK